MSEIKRGPIVTENADGDEFTTFDQNHTYNDVIRYLLNEHDTEELVAAVRRVGEEG